MNYHVDVGELPRFDVGPLGSHARILHGMQHGLSSVSLMLAEIQPGEGPAWHRHAYGEVFVISEGEATYQIGDEVIRADANTVVFAPAGVAHRFVNCGESVLRQTAIHLAPKVEIEWLEDMSPAEA